MFRLFWVHNGFERRVIHFCFRFCWINNDLQIPNRSSALFWAPDCRNMGPSFIGRKSALLTQGNMYSRLRDAETAYVYICTHFLKFRYFLQATFVYNIGKRKLLIQTPSRWTLVLSRVQNCLCKTFFFRGGGVEGGAMGDGTNIFFKLHGIVIKAFSGKSHLLACLWLADYFKIWNQIYSLSSFSQYI